MFKEALLSSAKRLHTFKEKGDLKDYAMIGAFAVSRWARPRATADIDYIIALGSSSAPQIASELKGIFREGALGDPLMGVVEYSEKNKVPIQLLIFPTAWEEVALHKIDISQVDNVDVPVADWRALVLLKLYAGSALDLEDAQLIISQVKPSARDAEYLRLKATRLRVSRRLVRILGE